jgi:hypothetical protein
MVDPDPGSGFIPSNDEAGAYAPRQSRTDYCVTDARDPVLANVVTFDLHQLLRLLASRLGHRDVLRRAAAAGDARHATPTRHERDAE